MRAARKRSKVSSKKSAADPIKCICDGNELQLDHIGIRCENGHHMCPGDCSQTFVKTILEDPKTNIPIKCPQCKGQIIAGSFERQLTDEEKVTYVNVIAMKEISPNEFVQHCIFCSYFEIWQRPATGFMHCRACGKSHCTICHLEFIPPADGVVEDEDMPDAGDEGDESKMEGEKSSEVCTTSFGFHMECAELEPGFKAIEEALALGNGGVKCPACGIVGRKDDACTHITCQHCGVVFCYVCGIEEEHLDKKDPDEDIHSHNVDWDINELRCPMYLTQVAEVDKRWSTDDAECVALISRTRTLELLRKAHRRMGAVVFRRLWDKYGSIANCGFTEEEILRADLTLFRRQAVT